MNDQTTNEIGEPLVGQEVDSPKVPDEVVIKKESNNNQNSDGGAATTSIHNSAKSSSMYDVLGTNDQELARRQYPSDDGDDNDSEEQTILSRHKRLALESLDSASKRPSAYKVEHDLTSDGSNGRSARSSPGDQQDTSSNNGYPKNEYDDNSTSSINENSNENGYQRSTSQPQQQHQQPDEPEQMRKLFIGGLDYKTTEETLKQHFEKFGHVTECEVKREPQSRRSRGFGFVIYANSEMVDKAQSNRPHEVDGREVQSKRAVSREDSGKPEAQATVKKVYLNGLSDDIEESELREYFKDFGNIVNINIVAHKETGRRRGFAFVEYDDYDPVDKIVLKKFHTIRDKRIEARKAIPKVEMDARKRVDPRAAMANAMIALSGPSLDGPVGGRPRTGRGGNGGASNAYLWEGPYAAASGYPAGYSGQAGLDVYPPHYHPSAAHYGTNSYMMTGGQGGSLYGFRNAHNGGGSGGGGGGNMYGRNNYASQAGSYAAAVNYGAGFAGAQGGAGPMRLSYQHRGWGPYGNSYGTHRGRGYNP